MKRHCSRCNRELPLTKDFFYVSRKSPTGFQSRCKDCDNGHTAERRLPSARRASHFTVARTDFSRPRVVRVVCVECCDLPHRRQTSGCRVCGQPYADEPMQSIEAFTERRETRELI